MTTQIIRTLYPSIEPYQTGFLKVDEDHLIYWEESGNPKGQPVLFFHGGPGLGTRPHNRCFFNPAYYRIILFDQRGCGKSLPFSALKNNTTWDLVLDIEKLRLYLNVDKWLLFGGSWGSTLALTYAIKHPKQVEGLILRGIFLCRSKDLDWFYQSGASYIFPDFWEDFITSIPFEERNNTIGAFYRRLLDVNIKQRNEATKSWAMWGGRTYKIACEDIELDESAVEEAYAPALMECHYLYHRGFLDTDNWILENISTIQHLPCTIIQGRYDMLCPMQNAWDLHVVWPKAKLKIIPCAGHSSSEPGILDALIQASDSFVKQIVDVD